MRRRFRLTFLRGIIAVAMLSVANSTVDAQDSNTLKALKKPEFGLILSTKMRLVSMESSNPTFPQTRQQLRDLPLFPLSPNRPVIYFPHLMVHDNGNPWIPILTEDGLWGMSPLTTNNAREILTQSDIELILNEFSTDHLAWILVKNPIRLENGLLVLGNNELYPIDLNHPARVLVPEDNRLTKSKYYQIDRNFDNYNNIKIEDNYYLISLEENDDYSSKVEFLNLQILNDYYSLVKNIEYAYKRSSHLFARWNKIFITTGVKSVSCNAVSEIKTDSENRSEFSASLEIDLAKLLSSISSLFGDIGLSAKLSADRSRSVSEKITSRIVESAKSYAISLVELERSGNIDDYLFGNSQDCVKSPQHPDQFEESGPKYFRMSTKDIAGPLIDKDLYEDIIDANQHIVWNDRTGTLQVTCKSRDFEFLSDFFLQELDLSQTEAMLVLSQLLVIDKQTEFETFENC